jgi:hypothetical protein
MLEDLNLLEINELLRKMTEIGFSRYCLEKSEDDEDFLMYADGDLCRKFNNYYRAYLLDETKESSYERILMAPKSEIIIICLDAPLCRLPTIANLKLDYVKELVKYRLSIGK